MFNYLSATYIIHIYLAINLLKTTPGHKKAEINKYSLDIHALTESPCFSDLSSREISLAQQISVTH